MGLNNLPTGTYDLLWFDTESGVEIEQEGVTAKAGNNAWPKSDAIGNEIALHVQRARTGPRAWSSCSRSRN